MNDQKNLPTADDDGLLEHAASVNIVDRLIAENPHLTPNPDDDRATMTRNMRRELTLAFPGIKFTVRTYFRCDDTETYVSWNDGPAEDAVSAIVKKYAQGVHNRAATTEARAARAWASAFGGVGYVFTDRGPRTTVPLNRYI